MNPFLDQDDPAVVAAASASSGEMCFAAAISEANGFKSTPIDLPPSAEATRLVVPLPFHGSSTIAPFSIPMSCSTDRSKGSLKPA